MLSTLSLFSSLLLAYTAASPYGPPSGPPSNRGPPSGPPSNPGGGPPGGEGPPGSEGPSGGYGGPLFDIKANSPAYTWLYQYPLPIPAIAQPIYTETINGQKIEYFELTIEPFQTQIYPNLGAANFVGYNGTFPGPTFKVEKGVETIVRYLNKGDDPAAVHLHGSPSHAPWDGWASDYVKPGQYKDYYYPNSQAGPLWYHDHSDGLTTKTVYYGQAGVHLIHDPAEDILDLPSGDYDIPLALMDKIYQSNGQLVNPETELIDFYGDIIEVNGQPWPYFTVEPRKYRLRFFNMGLSRPYDLQFVDDNNDAIEVQVVASDAGLFEYPVSTNDIYLSMGERYEVVIDFSGYKGDNVTLTNILSSEFVPEYQNTDQVMRFVVGTRVTDNSNNGPVPSKLKDVNWPANVDTIDHVFNFQHGGDDIWTINGEDFDDINNRVLARPLQGSVENWEVVYASGPGVHPVHVHLVNFQIISRTGGSRGGVLPYEKAGLKDTVLLDAGETVVLRAVYGPWNGLYTFHCHNLVHEDHMMMDAFNVTLLEELGYRFNSTYDFNDPADPRYAARDYSAAAYQPAAIKSAISSLGNLNAYAPIASIVSAEAAYYTTAGYPSVSAAATATAESGPGESGQPFSGPSGGASPTGFGGPTGGPGGPPTGFSGPGGPPKARRTPAPAPIARYR